MTRLVHAIAPIAALSFCPPGASASDDGALLLHRWEQAGEHAMRPASRQLGDVRATFDGLVAQWLRECRFESSLTRMTAHPAYQRIIGLGPRAVPLLLHELEHRPNHWGAALRALTGADPVPPQDAGHVQRMAARWIDWARATGIRW